MTILKLTATVLLLGTAALALPMSAHAQFMSSGNAPITISADDADYLGNKTILTGGVDVRQGDIRMLADKMTVYNSGSGGLTESDFSRIVAEGNFYYLTPEQNVRGHKGVYTKVDDTFVVTGNVILKQQDGNVVTGDKLHYNLTSRNARVVGSCKGRKCGSRGRVNILIKNANTDSGRKS